MIKCHRDSYTEEEARINGWDMEAETELDLLNWARLRENYCKSYPEEVAVTTAAAAFEEGTEGLLASNKKARKDSSPVYQFVRPINPEEHAGYNYQCILCGELLKKHGYATDKLIAHFGDKSDKLNKHPEEFKKIISNSSHTSLKVDEEGNVSTGKLGFKLVLSHHIRFAFWLAAQFRPLAISLDDKFRDFCNGLRPGYAPPSKETIWKILEIAAAMTRQKLKADIMLVKDQIGSPFISLQTDMLL